MRSIMFRGIKTAINTEDLISTKSKWVYGCLVYDTLGQPYIVGSLLEDKNDCFFEYWEPVDPETVGQFIGVYDKNKTKIYEGDIVQYKYYRAVRRWWIQLNEIDRIENEFKRQCEIPEIRRGVIEYNYGMFMLDYFIHGIHIDQNLFIEHKKGRNCDYEIKAWDFEIVGNVYENPELLTEK